MQRVLPFLATFAVGVLVGILLAGRGPWATDGPVEPPVRDGGTEARTVPPLPHVPAPVEHPAEPAHLEGRPSEATPAAAEAPATSRPRVARDGRVELAVELVRADGKVPERGMLYWSADPETPPHALRCARWQGPRTSHFVEPGDVWIHATGGLHGEYRSEPVHVRVSADGPLEVVRLVLERPPGVRGKVVLPATFDRPRLTVRLQRFTGAAPPATPTFEPSSPSASPEAEGGFGFAFLDLEPGGYLLALAIDRRENVVVETVWVRGDMVEQDLVVEAFDPRHFMELTVLGPDGRPLRDEAQVSINFSGEGTGVAGGNMALLREDGVFVVDHAPRWTLREDGTYKDGSYTIHVTTRDRGEIVRRYVPGETPSMTIRVGDLEDLTVRLTDFDAESAHAHVRVGVRARGETGVTNPQQVGPDGVVSSGARQAGAYEVVFLAGKPRAGLVAVHPVEFAPGEGPIEVPAPVFRRLVVRLPGNAPDPVFSLSRSFAGRSWSYGWPVVDPSGELVFEELTEGTYTLEGHYGDRWVKREVRILGDTVVRLD